MSAGRPIVVEPAARGDLEPDPIPAEQVLAGEPHASERVIGHWRDGTSTGIWRCEPGRFRDVEVDETFVVLEGSASILHEGAVHEIGPGDVCVLPAGAETEWVVHRTIVKVFVLGPEGD